MGNLAQIDNKYVTPVSSGLTYVTEKFKDWPYANVIQLEGVVRSRLADFSENNL
jgi:PhoH-like ATPase